MNRLILFAPFLALCFAAPTVEAKMSCPKGEYLRVTLNKCVPKSQDSHLWRRAEKPTRPRVVVCLNETCVRAQESRQ
jgi:hypothetical protein